MPEPIPEPKSNLQKFYERAKFYADKHIDASPGNKAPPHLACAESINNIHKDVFGDPICVENELSTYFMRRSLKERLDFKKTTTPKKGTILLYATGYGGKNDIKYGHVMIFYDDFSDKGEDARLMGNNSFKNGIFEITHTLKKARDYWVKKGGYEELMFDKI